MGATAESAAKTFLEVVKSGHAIVASALAGLVAFFIFPRGVYPESYAPVLAAVAVAFATHLVLALLAVSWRWGTVHYWLWRLDHNLRIMPHTCKTIIIHFIATDCDIRTFKPVSQETYNYLVSLETRGYIRLTELEHDAESEKSTVSARLHPRIFAKLRKLGIEKTLGLCGLKNSQA